MLTLRGRMQWLRPEEIAPKATRECPRGESATLSAGSFGGMAQLAEHCVRIAEIGVRVPVSPPF